MTAVAPWLDELNHCQQLLKTRPQLADSLVSSLEAKLQTFQVLQPSELVALYQSLETCTLPQDKVKQLQAIVDAKATGGAPGCVLKAMMVPQELTTPQNFLTSRDWHQLDTMSMWQGIEIVTNRLRSLGLTALKESTKRSCVAVVVWFQVQKSGQVPPYPAIYDMVLRLTNSFQILQGTEVSSGCTNVGSLPAFRH